MLGEVVGIAQNLYAFYGAFFFFLFGGKLAKCPFFKDSRQARVHVFSLALIFKLWSEEHYRSGTFQNDKLKNLRNTAVPGTGIPLSLFCYFRFTGYLCVLLFYPLCALVVAFVRKPAKPAAKFREILLEPTNWFSFWRLNCRLVSYHYHITKEPEYQYEDKWTFLKFANEHGIPVTPFFTCESIIVKHRNEEGGLGLHKFRNATADGDWIIQEFVKNGKFVASLLPDNAPLSTFRIITASRHAIAQSANPALTESKGNILALSCVFRAGRQNAITDHSSVLFDMDVKTGKILQGSYNWNWYQLGPLRAMSCPWDMTAHATTNHPDKPSIRLTGQVVPRFEEMLSLCLDAHALFPNIPVCGWDVALTDAGPMLLEVNFSCNFFQATFDRRAYFEFVEEFLLWLESPNAKSKKAVAPKANGKDAKQAGKEKGKGKDVGKQQQQQQQQRAEPAATASTPIVNAVPLEQETNGTEPHNADRTHQNGLGGNFADDISCNTSNTQDDQMDDFYAVEDNDMQPLVANGNANAKSKKKSKKKKN